MGLRFRKSIKLGKGVKLNLSKKGFGVSIGGKGARYSINSSGRSTTTLGIPGTGLSYTHTSGGKKRKSASKSTTKKKTRVSYAALKQPMKTGLGMMILTICLGFTGVQWFVSKRWAMGFLYLFTGGLFFIGWLVDVIRQIVSYVKNKNEGQE
jgi:hypothetical protein